VIAISRGFFMISIRLGVGLRFDLLPENSHAMT